MASWTVAESAGHLDRSVARLEPTLDGARVTAVHSLGQSCGCSANGRRGLRGIGLDRSGGEPYPAFLKRVHDAGGCDILLAFGSGELQTPDQRKPDRGLSSDRFSIDRSVIEIVDRRLSNIDDRTPDRPQLDCAPSGLGIRSIKDTLVHPIAYGGDRFLSLSEASPNRPRVVDACGVRILSRFVKASTHHYVDAMDAIVKWPSPFFLRTSGNLIRPYHRRAGPRLPACYFRRNRRERNNIHYMRLSI